MPFSRRNFLRRASLASLTGLTTDPVFGLSVDPFPTPGDSFISLDKNENAYGPSAKVLESIRVASLEAGKYPSEHAARQLIEKIADLHKIDPNRVILGAGSTEILRVACDAFLGRGKQLIQPSPTYPDMEVYARSIGTHVISEAANTPFTFDLDAMRSHLGSGLVYICNPNNPTGTVSPRAQLESFISMLAPSYRIVIDEAYHEFCPPTGTYESFLEHPLKDDRIIVTRTFSLAYGLAGLRVGYGIASENDAERMRAFLTQNSVNSSGLRAATAALEDKQGLAETVRKNAEARQEFFNQCQARSIKPLDSHTNFYAFDTFNPANLLIQYFRNNNILIAPFSLTWDTYVRVTFGKPQDMKTFWRFWDTSPIDKSAIRH